MSFQEGWFRNQRERVSLDLTPLIDCIFQLLVFFLLTASFITTPSMGVELPKASAKASTTQQRDLMVVVTRTGGIEFQDKAVTVKELLGRLKVLQKKRPDARVLIQADTKAYHGTVVRVMDVAKVAGFRRLGVAISNQQ